MTITLQAEPAGQATLTIRDTGVGLPADLEIRQAEGFGLHLGGALAEQLEGTIAVMHDGGTCITLTIESAHVLELPQKQKMQYDV